MNGPAGLETSPRDRLSVGQMDLGEVMSLVRALEEEESQARVVTFGLSGNVTLDVLETYLRRQALLDGYRAVVFAGSYDDHVGNVRRFREAGADVVIVLSFLDNLLPCLEARLAHAGADLLPEVGEKLRQEIRLVLDEGRTLGRIYLCLLHRFAPPSAAGLNDRVDAAIAALNAILREEAASFPNVRLLRLDAVVTALGWEKAFSARFYYRYRSPYRNAFFEKLSQEISVVSRAAASFYYKALVLDADNTLWGGLLGEDMPSGLKLDPHDYPGNIFWSAQQEFLSLQRQGVLLALCSKNDERDLREVLSTHPRMVLRPEHFVAIHANWEDKVANLERIAAGLNIGLESLVFLDDSPFELEAVRARLPMVRTLQVPGAPYEYPGTIRKLKELFLATEISGESRGKSEQYRIRALAEEERSRFRSHAEYVASLGMKLDIRLRERRAVGRIAELTQKSNQFNLTTRRYTEGQIEELMDREDADVFSLHVSDRFGDSGLTGVLILRREGDRVDVDTFLLSCRVLGRGIEFALWPVVLSRQVSSGAKRLFAEYIPTAKNGQTMEFFDRLGLTRVKDGEGRRLYEAGLGDWAPSAGGGIEVACDF